MVLVAEYLKVITTEGELVRDKKPRKVQQKNVVQYMTNGLEILDEGSSTRAWRVVLIRIYPVILCIESRSDTHISD